MDPELVRLNKARGEEFILLERTDEMAKDANYLDILRIARKYQPQARNGRLDSIWVVFVSPSIKYFTPELQILILPQVLETVPNDINTPWSIVGTFWWMMA